MSEDIKIVQRVAMKAVIVSDGKILLLREANTYEEGTGTGRYHFPGGRINPGENFKTALKREVAEETGLDVELVMPIFVGEWSPVIKGVKNHIVATFIVCEAKNDKIVLSEEHDHYEWVDPKDWKKLDVMDPDGEVIETYKKLSEGSLKI